MIARCGNFACNHIFDQGASGLDMCGDCMAEWVENDLTNVWINGGAWPYMADYTSTAGRNALWSFLLDLTYEMNEMSNPQ